MACTIAKETIWDNNSDLEDAEDAADHMLSTGSEGCAKAQQQPQGWMRDMPAVSFDSACYDLLLIKPYMA